MMSRRRLANAAVTAATLLLAAPASGYVRTRTDESAPVKSPSSCVVLRAYTNEPPPSLTSERFLQAALGAGATWSRGAMSCDLAGGPPGSTTGLQILVVPVLDATANIVVDKKNRLTFRRGTWSYAREALAITTVTALKATGEILDADIEVNAVNFTWDDLVGNPTPAPDTQDIQNTLTHEYGHLVGFDHNCYNGEKVRQVDHTGQPVMDCTSIPAGSSLREATMFAAVIRGDTKRRTLDADDTRAVCEVYPPSTEMCATTVPPEGDGGGCRFMPRGHASPGTVLLALLAFGGALRLRARRG